MKHLVTTTAIASLLAGAALAQETTTVTATEMASPDAAQIGENSLLGSQMMGIRVFAAPQGAGDVAPSMSSAELAEYQPLGQISDIVIGRDGEMQGIVIALEEVPVEPGEGYATSDAGPVGTEGVRFGSEVLVGAEYLSFVTDDTAPNIWWAVLGMSAEEIAQAQPIDRSAMATPAGIDGTMATGTMGATGTTATNPALWRGNRTAWTAPAVTRDGYLPVPTSEVSAENLQGATVYDATGDRIGNVGEIVLGQDPSEVGYVVLDIGGFLGIGGRNVAIGLDEMTILRTEGWDEIQVHVDATEDALRAMTEYQE